MKDKLKIKRLVTNSMQNLSDVTKQTLRADVACKLHSIATSHNENMVDEFQKYLSIYLELVDNDSFDQLEALANILLTFDVFLAKAVDIPDVDESHTSFELTVQIANQVVELPTDTMFLQEFAAFLREYRQKVRQALR